MKSEDSARSGRAAAQRARPRADSRRRYSARFIAASTRVRAGLHRQMQERHQLRHVAMRRDQVVVHVARVRGRVADAARAPGSRPAPGSGGRDPNPAVRPGAAIGVDVLAEQRDLARAGGDQARAPRAGSPRPAGSAPRRACRARRRRCRTCRSLPGSVRKADTPGGCARSCGSRSNLLSTGNSVSIDGARLRARGAPAARAGDDRPAGRRRGRRTAPARPAPRPRPGRRSRRPPAACRAPAALAARIAQPAQAAELGIDLLGRLLADVAGVQDDQIGVVRPVGHARSRGMPSESAIRSES